MTSDQAAAFTLPVGEPTYSKQMAEAYLEKHSDEVKPDLIKYKEQHQLTSYTGSYRNYILHGTKVLEAAADQVIVVLSFDYGTNWTPRSASKVVRMQWIGSALKIVGHS